MGSKKNLKNLSDNEIVKLTISDNQDFYEELVRRYQNRLLRYIQYYVSDGDQAQDVAQEAFIKAFTNLKGFNQKYKFSSWIYRIAHNEAINFIKKHKKELSVDQNGWFAQIADKKIDLEGDLEKKEISKLLHSSLDRLPFKYKDVLILFYLEERSYGEISDILKVSIGTVGTHLSRGKKELIKIVKERGYNGKKD